MFSAEYNWKAVTPVSMRKELPVAGYNFYVTIGDGPTLSFTKVANVSVARKYETITEGGMDGYARTFLKPDQQQAAVVFERGISDKKSEELEKYGLKPGGHITKPVTIFLLDNKGTILRAFGFNEGVVIRWDLNGIDAMSGQILIERFEVAHSGFIEIKV
jgi:phage tail-like protein